MPSPYPHPTPSQLREKNEERRLKQLLEEEFGSNRTDVYLLGANELTGVWVSTKKAANKTDEEIEQSFQEITGIALDTIRNHASDAASAVVLTKLARDMGRSGNILGTYRIVSRRGSKLIVFRGWPGLRKHLNAPVYGLQNPKVVALGVGQSGLRSLLRGGVLLTLVISPTVRTIEWLFTDQEAALETVLANISTDIVKGIISAGAAFFAGAVVIGASGAATIAVAPVAAGIAAAVAVGVGLDWLDNHLGISRSLANSLTEIREEWRQSPAGRDTRYYFGTTRGQLAFIQRFMR